LTNQLLTGNSPAMKYSAHDDPPCNMSDSVYVATTPGLTVISSAQRAHSKLQKPPHMRSSESGTAADATNTQWRERTAAGVTRPCGSKLSRGGFCQLV